jgi:hypothetical protein
MSAVLQFALPGLEPEIEARCDDRLKVARTHMAAGCWHWVEAGKQFAANKAELRGHWAGWCRKNDVVLVTADALVRIADRFVDKLVATTSSSVQIDFEALRLLASPAVSDETRQAAIERASAGERITKQEAEAMVAAAKADQKRQTEEVMRATIAEFEAAEERRRKAAIKQATRDLRADKKTLADKLKAIRDEAKREPDTDAIATMLCRALGVPRLGGSHWQLLAQILGRGISVGHKTYAPASVEQIREAEANLRFAASVTEAMQALSAAPPAPVLLAACYPAQRALIREKLDNIDGWISQCRHALTAYTGEAV